MAVSIRVAEPGDLPAILRVMEAAYAPIRASGLALPDMTEGLAEEIEAGNLIVAEQGGEIVGGAQFALSLPEARLANLFVSPEAGGGGVGQGLISAVEARAMAAGAESLGLTTHEGLTRTIAFYQRLGWARVGQGGAKVFFRRELREESQ